MDEDTVKEYGMAHYTLAQFLSDVDVVVRHEPDPQVVQYVRPLLQQLLAQRDWLDEKFRRPVSGKPYTQYLLYTPADEAWSLVAFVWPRGSTTPIHDHCTWGVIGVYQGQETETLYRIVEGSVVAGKVRIAAQGTAVIYPGEVGCVVPPHDVHCVANNGSDVAVSIHVYGTNIGQQARHVFDLDTGQVKNFVSGYDQPEQMISDKDANV
jgi:predicted metal-dependent enzyme (double-stranded beta helix superfamily)